MPRSGPASGPRCGSGDIRRVWSMKMRKVGLKIRTAGMVLALSALVAGCASIRDHRGYLIDQTLLDSIQPGIDNRLSVEKTLGRPTFMSQFGRQDYYYVSQNVKTPPFGRPKQNG